MRIDLDKIDREQFMVHPHTVAGEVCHLVQPQHVGAKWTPDNLICRSSLWDSQGNPVSLSWRKHFNWEEQPDIEPAPASLDGVELMEKVDGSTLLVSRFRDTVIVRTRGTVDATKLDNGDEIAGFRAKYPIVFAPAPGYTYVYEWVSPRNQIVITYPEPDLYMTGIIVNDDYRYLYQSTVDDFAYQIGVKRPRRYQFNTLPEMLDAVKAFEGVEGICAYYGKGNQWRKCKAASYLARHRFKERATLPNTLDLFFTQGRPDAATFKATLARDFDAECMAMVETYVDQITTVYAATQVEVADIYARVQPLKVLSRRDAALKIQGHFGPRAGIAFKALDGRELGDREWRKLLEGRLGL